MMVIHYNGDREGHTVDPLRGDARVSLFRPENDGYRLPPSHDPFDSRTNIRAGVPLWLLRSCDEEARVLGIGKLHPRWNAATIHFYDPDTRRHRGHKFFPDPRIDFRALPEDYPDLEELQREIAAAGGAVAPLPRLAPRYTDQSLPKA